MYFQQYFNLKERIIKCYGRIIHHEYERYNIYIVVHHLKITTSSTTMYIAHQNERPLSLQINTTPIPNEHILYDATNAFLVNVKY
jgi:hypothetical protein